MLQSPSWEANWFSGIQEIPHILWSLKVHYHIHKCLSPGPILSQHDPVHTPTSYFLKIHLNAILPSTPGSPKWSLSLTFPHQNPVYASPLPSMHYMPRSSHPSRFYHPNNNGWEVQISQLLIMQLLPLRCYLIPPRPKYSSQHPILKHIQHTFLLNVSNHVSHPYKTIGNIIVLYILRPQFYTHTKQGGVDLGIKKHWTARIVRLHYTLKQFC